MSVFMSDEMFFERVFNKLDSIDERIGELCDRLTKVEADYNNHIENMERTRQDRDKKIYIVFGIAGGILTLLQIYQILRGL